MYSCDIASNITFKSNIYKFVMRVAKIDLRFYIIYQIYTYVFCKHR